MAWKQSLVMGDTWITDILAKHIFIIEKEGYYNYNYNYELYKRNKQF